MNEELLTAVEIFRVRHYDSGWFIPIKLSDCEIAPFDIGASKSLQDLHYLNFYEEWDTAMESLIESGDGAGFHNSDLGHPVYVLGALDASEETHTFWEYADTSKKNRLFKMISKLSKELKAINPDISTFIWWYDFSEWKDFCKFAIDVYNKKRKL